MPQLILLTGFAPFGGERSNPSWDIASNLDGHSYYGVPVKSMRLPVKIPYTAPEKQPRG